MAWFHVFLSLTKTAVEYTVRKGVYGANRHLLPFLNSFQSFRKNNLLSSCENFLTEYEPLIKIYENIRET